MEKVKSETRANSFLPLLLLKIQILFVMLIYLVAQTVKNPPVMWETWVSKIPWKGNSYPLQYSYMENCMDRGAWQATVQWRCRVGNS